MASITTINYVGALPLLFFLLVVLAAEAQDQICSCAPTVFNFVLDLSVEATTPSDDGECAFNTIAGNPGVEFSLCRQALDGATPLTASASALHQRLPLCNLSPDSKSVICREKGRTLAVEEKVVSNGRLQDGGHNELRDRELETANEVTSAQFLEFGSDYEIKDNGIEIVIIADVINQDDTYINTVLQDGAAMQFVSISSQLNPCVPLEDQMDKVPGGALVTMKGKTESGQIQQVDFLWLYDMNDCGSENHPVQVGDKIGWVTVVSMLIRRDSCAFCH